MRAKYQIGLLAAMMGVFMGLISKAEAQTEYSWTKNSGNWSTAGNWNPAVVPDGVGVVVSFTNAIANTSKITNDVTPRTLGALVCGSFITTAAFTLMGTNLVFDNGANEATLTMLSRSRNASIDTPLTLNSDLVISNNSTNTTSGNTMTLTGDVKGSKRLINQGNPSGFSNVVNLNNTLSGAMSILQNASNSELRFGPGGQGTFTNGMEIRAGTVQTQNALNTNLLVTLSGGNLRLIRDTNNDFKAKRILVMADSSISIGRHSADGAPPTHTLASLSISNQTLALAGRSTFVTLPGTYGLNVSSTVLTGTNALFSVADSSRLTLSSVSGSSGLTKIGAGSLVLSTGNTYNGVTCVQEGTLTLAASNANTTLLVEAGVALVNCTQPGAITIRTGATIGGTGTVSAATLAVAPGARLRATILDAAGHADVLTFSGTVDVSNLTLDLLSANLLTEGQRYPVLACTGHTGVFAENNLPARWRVDYAVSDQIAIVQQREKGAVLLIK